MLHDQKVFPDPMSFRPERFLDQNGRLRKLEPHEDPSTIAFGFGRRICPGMFLADNSIFINIARLMWAFDIQPALDAEGKPIIPDSTNYTDGFNSIPVSFQCRIVPRNEKVIETVKSEYDSAMARLGSWSW